MSFDARQLIELLSAVSSFTDESDAARGAAEGAAQAFEAAVSAVVVERRLLACVGFPQGRVPEHRILTASPRSAPVLEVPGVGACATLVVPMGDVGGHLLVGRDVGDAFTSDDRHLLRGMAQIFQLSLRMLRTVREMHEAHHDSLTGVPNRALFLEQFRTALSGAYAARRDLSVCFVDLDDFKWVNDTLGHDAGDTLLVQVTRRIRASLRPGDLIGRLGGDEFAIVLCDSDRELAGGVVARIQEAIGRPLTIDGETIRPRASVGIAARPAGPTDVGTMLREADAAMYREKSTRRSVTRGW